jgi:hypothetical protein
MDLNLERKISSLPLIPICDGRFVSIDVILNEAERLGFIAYVTDRESLEIPMEDIVVKSEPYGFVYEFCRRLVGLDKVMHYSMVVKKREDQAKISKKVEPVVKSVRDKIQAAEQVRGFADEEDRTIPGKDMEILPEKEISDAQLITGQVEDPELAAASIKDWTDDLSLSTNLSPEDRLLFAIRKEFRIIRERDNYKLSEKVLRESRVINRKDMPAITYKNDRLMINFADPLVKNVANSLDDSPGKLYYLLSVIYSTINREVLDITDEDEMKFQMVMLDNLLQHPLAVS